MPNGEEEVAEEVVVPANLEPIVFGPPAFGSQDPMTSGFTLLPREDLPEMVEVTDLEPVGTEEVPLGEGEDNLSAMTKDELQSYAEDIGIEGVDAGNMTKAEMITAIQSEFNDD